jgi:hypothetical protein
MLDFNHPQQRRVLLNSNGSVASIKHAAVPTPQGPKTK